MRYLTVREFEKRIAELEAKIENLTKQPVAKQVIKPAPVKKVVDK